MRIYLVDADVDKYQYFMFEDDSLYDYLELFRCDGTPKAEKWVPPDVFIYEPKLKKGNFLYLWSTAAFVVDQVALEALRDLLEISGELLPLPYKGRLYHVVNVTQCFDILDVEKTKWEYGGAVPRIKKYVFDRTRVPEVPLFIIPQERGSEIFTVEFCGDPEKEFKARVEQFGLTGLKFTELWHAEG